MSPGLQRPSIGGAAGYAGVDRAHGGIGALHVMHIVYALQPGGMEFGVVKVVNGLVGSGIRSSICSTAPARGPMKALVAPGVEVFELQRREGNDLRLVWRLTRLLRRERPDIVHTHGWGTLVEGLVASRLAGVPVVVHGEHGTLQLKRRQRWVQRASWSCANQVLSVSTRLAEHMATEVGYAPGRIRTVRNGVDLSRFQAGRRREARLALGLPAEAVIVGTVGRLVPVKDQATLLEAVALLRGEGTQVAALLAGDGPLSGRLRQQAEALGISADVHLLGHRPDVELVLAALDVFVLPSLSEGLSNTILEAMATGLPVVATRVGGADELVIDGVTGILVPPGAPVQLAAALAGILRDPAQRDRMGHAARRRAESEFSLPVVIRTYQDLYEELARTHVRAS
jgi:sugar transferase (PEP-CTERM/EpsH1 system associated)